MTGISRAVFLSYASEDAAAAQRLCAVLRAAGVEVWFDQSELRGGDAWDRRIRQQIHDCALFIALVSAHSDARDEGYFRREWRLAIQRTQDMADDRPFLLPVAVDDTIEVRARVPEEFRGVQWTHLPVDAAIPHAFVDRVLGLLSPKAVPDAGGPPSRPRAGMTGAVTPMVTAGAPTSPAAEDRGGAHQTRRVLLIAAIVGLMGLGIWALARRPHLPGKPVVASITEQSIAVLPFVDMSEKRDQEYFSDGLTEELIDHLAHAPDLKVISRTSSFQFKGKNEDVRTIAEKLGVANVLEGSVRKSGGQLRVTAQLIRAADGTHLWSQTYDRDLKDIFKLQDEIATTVSSALRVALSPPSRAQAPGTVNLDAYNLMLMGIYYYARGNQGDSAEAIRYYLEAVRLDPDYAQAWGRLARTYIWESVMGQLLPAEAAAKAQQAAQRALAIDPDCAVAHYAEGNIHRYFEYDWQGAIGEFEKAIALEPASELSAQSRDNIALIRMVRTGRAEEAIRSLLNHVAHNPLDTNTLGDLAWAQQVAGQLDASAATSRRMLALNANFTTAQSQYAYTLLMMGKSTEALAAAERESDQASRLSMLACARWRLGQRAESTAAVRTLEAEFAKQSAYLIAMAHACRDETAAAIDWLERAYRQRDGNLSAARIEPLFRGLHGEPRYQALLVKMNLAD